MTDAVSREPARHAAKSAPEGPERAADAAPAAPRAALEPQVLPRGGLVVETSAGPVQFGVPPETIKDSLLRAHGVPRVYVLTRDFFSYERGVSFAEMEFPIYYNFFVQKRRAVVVCTVAQQRRLLAFMAESMFGPPGIAITREVGGGAARFPWFPDLEKEIAYFRRHPEDPSRPMQFDDVLSFHLFDEQGRVTVAGLQIHRTSTGGFRLFDPAVGSAVDIPPGLTLPPRKPEPIAREEPFRPPSFGVTILGSGHGFDPYGKTTGFILWINGRGIMVDPPVDTTEWLREREVPSRLCDAIILTHCHGDHDAGTLQKALLADRIRLYTTHTIHDSFLRKSEAITGLPQEEFAAVLAFRPLPIGKAVRLYGATFRFRYTLHSIPTIGFEVMFGGRSLVYTSDTLNDPDKIRELRDAGIMSPGRAQHLLDFPWHHDLIIHEAGVPPLHTQAEVLARLPAEIKERLYLVHTTAGRIPEGTGLRLAPEGLDATLTLETEAGSFPTKGMQWLTAMRAVDHFRELPVEKAIEFLEIVQELEFLPGDTVIRTGAPGERFYMILAGKAAIHAGEVQRKIFSAYDYFGEASLVLDVPRTADVIALTHLRVLSIQRDDFLRFIAGTDVERRMTRLFMNRGLETWALMDEHPVLQELNTSQRNELQSFIDLCELRAGEVIVTEGESPCPSFLVRSGRVREERAATPVRYHERAGFVSAVGDVFDGAPAPYTVTAEEETSLFVFEGQAWQRFLKKYPGLYLRLLHRYADR